MVIIHKKGLIGMNTLRFNDKVFDNYVRNNFDIKSNKVKLKHKHSFLVAKIAKEIAKKTGLDEELSYNIGLLHDFGRFEQIAKYNNFRDTDEFDHGAIGCELLFKKGHIKDFKIDERFYPLIYFAIYFHNKKEVDPKPIQDYLDSHKVAFELADILKYCHIVRDADKIDIFRVVTEKDFIIESNLDGITPSMKKEFESFETLNIKHSKTKLDRLVTHLSFMYGLHFKESYDVFDFKKTLKKLYLKYAPILNEEDMQYYKIHTQIIYQHVINDIIN